MKLSDILKENPCGSFEIYDIPHRCFEGWRSIRNRHGSNLDNHLIYDSVSGFGRGDGFDDLGTCYDDNGYTVELCDAWEYKEFFGDGDDPYELLDSDGNKVEDWGDDYAHVKNEGRDADGEFPKLLIFANISYREEEENEEENDEENESDGGGKSIFDMSRAEILNLFGVDEEGCRKLIGVFYGERIDAPAHIFHAWECVRDYLDAYAVAHAIVTEENYSEVNFEVSNGEFEIGDNYDDPCNLLAARLQIAYLIMDDYPRVEDLSACYSKNYMNPLARYIIYIGRNAHPPLLPVMETRKFLDAETEE